MIGSNLAIWWLLWKRNTTSPTVPNRLFFMEIYMLPKCYLIWLLNHHLLLLTIHFCIYFIFFMQVPSIIRTISIFKRSDCMISSISIFTWDPANNMKFVCCSLHQLMSHLHRSEVLHFPTRRKKDHTKSDIFS